MRINTYWDGTPCKNPMLHGTVELAMLPQGLRITASLPHQVMPNIPAAPSGARVGNLWEYDVVECFLVGEERYLEVELGAGGHFLVLEFTAPRVRSNAYETFTPEMTYEPHADDGRWRASIVIPWDMVPRGVKAANAFVIVGDAFVCAHPLPGPKPDFHQPDRFPSFVLPAPQVLVQFALPPVHEVQRIGSGLINATFRVTTADGDFALQSLHDVIPDAAAEDMRTVTAYLAERGMHVPALVAANDGAPFARDAAGIRWRVYPWIPGTVVDAVKDEGMARDAGRLVGEMHRHLAAFDYVPKGSIPHFHDTRFILDELRALRPQLALDAAAMADGILATLPALIVDDEARQLIHGDLKISNIVFDNDGRAVGVIDFDTILVHTRAIDVGDALRSWCNRTAEDDPEARCDMRLFDAACAGYAEGFGAGAGNKERYVRATKQIALELASRFLIDVVRDTYFGYNAARYPSRQAHNLARARGQYHLASTLPLS